MLLVTSVIFLLSTLGCAFAVNYTTFVVFRMIAGVSVGAASMLSPLYISEIAPAHLRGRMVSLNQFAIFSGAGAGLRFEPSAGRCRRRGQLAVDAGRDGRALRAVPRLPAVCARKSLVAGHEPLRRQGVQGAEPHQRPGDGPAPSWTRSAIRWDTASKDVPRAFQGGRCSNCC